MLRSVVHVSFERESLSVSDLQKFVDETISYLKELSKKSGSEKIFFDSFSVTHNDYNHGIAVKDWPEDTLSTFKNVFLNFSLSVYPSKAAQDITEMLVEDGQTFTVNATHTYDERRENFQE